VRTLADLLAERRWRPPGLAGTDVVVQPHCHHRAVLGFEADRALLAGAGARLTVVDGCCGLAGNFGAERGHYGISAAVAETALLPALRAAADGAVLLTDGFSCRVQAAQLAHADGLHLAELLAARLPAAG
jgi:Fe-S oxidoreductase